MAIYETARPAPFGAIAIHRVLSAFETLRETFTEWNNSRITHKALARLSDHELSDIGLSRNDISRF